LALYYVLPAFMRFLLLRRMGKQAAIAVEWRRRLCGGSLLMMNQALAGIFGAIAANPLYLRMVKGKREKLVPEIMRLTGKRMK